ncbi:MAG: type II secretion system protein [Syntrophorhabdus sp.]|jgi:prepilin-type N-terminal cleavage/methylation domain-containing protein|nr:type II secretion system protein [Syntrophorhabdus sp.]
MREGKTYSARRREKGFTSIELIVVIVVLSILTASIIVKNPFRIEDYSGIAKDQLIAHIRLAQLKAMGMKSPQIITFTVGSSAYNVANVQKTLPGNTTVTSVSTTVSNRLVFNSLGEPTSNGVVTLSGGVTVTVNPSTGRAE